MKTPVLMIHGMNCTGLVWAGFRAYFEAEGVRVYTPTIRPELRTSFKQDAPRALRELQFVDYVSELERDVLRIERETGERPAVVGHSMGGLIAQVLMSRDCVSAAVLISPTAPAGVHTPRSRVFWACYGAARRLGFTRAVIRPDRRMLDRFVFNALPVEARAPAYDAMVYESARVFADFSGFAVDESTVRVPVLTVAASRDRLVPAPLVRRTARKYAARGGEFREYARHAHWLYAEPGWEEPARDIHRWLDAALLRASHRPPRRATGAAARIAVAHDRTTADRA